MSDVADAALPLSGLLLLQNWMSPAFPIGAYTCSHGLEAAIADGTIDDATALREWLVDVLVHGSGRNDAIVLAASHAAAAEGRTDTLNEINELALALSAGAERRRESVLLGTSFRRAAAPWRSDSATRSLPPWFEREREEIALPVAIGALTARHGLPLLAVLATALQSTTANLAWIATRLVPLGQDDTLALLAGLEPVVARAAREAARSAREDLGGCAVLADIDSLRHEHLASRVCRT